MTSPPLLSICLLLGSFPPGPPENMTPLHSTPSFSTQPESLSLHPQEAYAQHPGTRRRRKSWAVSAVRKHREAEAEEPGKSSGTAQGSWRWPGAGNVFPSPPHR